MSSDAEKQAHKAWLGLLQPVGLVVSPPALVKAQAVLNRNVVALQQTLLSVVRKPPRGSDGDPTIDDFPRFCQQVLGWMPEDLAGAPGGPPLPEDLELVLPDYAETLRPTHAVIDTMAQNKVLMLVQVLPPGTDLDQAAEGKSKTGWQATPQAKAERLLREKEVPVGLLCNGAELRLVYAPRGESSGHLTFCIKDLCEVSGRMLLGALELLLSADRVFSAVDGRRLHDLLTESRKYQNDVSTKLADQVLGALWELLRGFQAADEASGGTLLGQVAREDPQHIYGGLLTGLLRQVFLLYAEDQGLISDDPIYTRNYSVTGLYERLREDAGRHADTMDQRYGAWAWLLSLWRLVFDGGGHAGFRLPTRHGQLFNPDEFPFLEGRPQGVLHAKGERFDAPRVPDGTIYRVLEALLVLDGERLSYRALDVEQIGSVYEAMMGFEVQQAHGPSLAVRPKHIVFNLDELLELAPGKRGAWLKEATECALTGPGLAALKTASTVEDVVAALGSKVSPRTPRPLSPGSLYLQPGEERRRSGSHYTPRELTEPIVRTTLRPVLQALGQRPTPDQILGLKVCDPAMGSGAFLVEACRQLAEHLVQAWEIHDCLPELPMDTEPLLHARRLVAQRCLYGVDKNPFAVNLAKLSLWLVTLARDHAFTFLDHALKHGDSLVGLTKKQIATFHWKLDDSPQVDWIQQHLQKNIEEALGWRDALQALDEGDYKQKRAAWWKAENALADARLMGDMVIAAFFGADKDKGREALRNQYRGKVEAWRAGEVHRHELVGIVEELRGGEKPVPPLHWEIEFPEVFGRENPGFDVTTGNPPFLKGSKVSGTFGGRYLAWLKDKNPGSHGNSDLVAHFFRRSFDAIRTSGTLGLLATNTISQGDTRRSGLLRILNSGGTIFAAVKRLRWKGPAAVVVSVVHIQKGLWCKSAILNGEFVPRISCFLVAGDADEDPKVLAENNGRSCSGVYVYGSGFIFGPKKGETPVAQLKIIRRDHPEAARLVHAYLGGEEFLHDPGQHHSRFAIDFEERNYEEAAAYGCLLSIVENKVKPTRKGARGTRATRWWLHAERRPELQRWKLGHKKMLMHPFNAYSLSFAFVPAKTMIAAPHCVFFFEDFSAFTVLQSRVHEVWVRFFGSSLKDDMRYLLTDCFSTFPSATSWLIDDELGRRGAAYYKFRASLMLRNDVGLTRTYNRFHDPDERDPNILKLRELHAAMDRAVLDAYNWPDIPTHCEFLLDYEIDEETWNPRKKKPYRYRWPEAVHDEVLARLLDLNQQRAEEERQAGLSANGTGGKKKQPTRRKRKASTSLSLFDDKPGKQEKP